MKKYGSIRVNLILTAGYVYDAQNTLSKSGVEEEDLEQALKSLDTAMGYIVAQRQSLKAHIKTMRGKA